MKPHTSNEVLRCNEAFLGLLPSNLAMIPQHTTAHQWRAQQKKRNEGNTILNITT
jgi:hypothetical protein